MPFKHPNPEEQLFNNSVLAPCPKPELGDCWIWIGAKTNSGYGKVTVHINKRRFTMLAHKWSLQVFKGARPASKKTRSTARQGLHLCNVKLCINPEHLKIGTSKENNRQTVKDGRHDPWSGVKARKEKANGKDDRKSGGSAASAGRRGNRPDQLPAGRAAGRVAGDRICGD